jgi:hypothetical protein
MTDQILNLLKLCLLALIYLFFARVLWSVWSEVRTPVVAAGTGDRTGLFGGRRAPRSAGRTLLVVLEPRGMRGTTHVLADTLTLGRTEDNDVVLESDTFISSHHARVEMRPSGPWLVDLGSTNGSYVNGQRITGEKSLRRGDRVQVGSTVMEVRT